MTAQQTTWYYKNRERILAEQKERYRTDPNFRERKRRTAVAYYHADFEKRERAKRAAYTWKRRQRLASFGLTEESYNELLAKQGGVCAICRQPDPRKLLAVDHDHQTGKVRGLLCDKHNKALGLLGDTVEGVQQALDYLKKAT